MLTGERTSRFGERLYESEGTREWCLGDCVMMGEMLASLTCMVGGLTNQCSLETGRGYYKICVGGGELREMELDLKLERRGRRYAVECRLERE